MSNRNPRMPGDKPRKKLLPQVMDPETETDEQIQTSRGGEGCRVVLFNDEAHTMLEVVAQLMKATGFDLDTSTDIMMRAHDRGRAVVTITDRPEADRIASTLREIALRVSVDEV